MLATRSTIAFVAWARGVLRRRDGVKQILIVVGALQLYEFGRRLIDPDWPVAMANARRIVDLEQVIGLGWEGQLQDWFLQLPDLVRAMNVFYFVGHFLLTAVFFVWLYRRSRDGFRLYRDGFLVATFLAFLIHWKFPTAPPRLADVGLLDTLRVLSGIDIGSDAAETYYNPLAAVPSLHAGYALAVGVGLWRYARNRVVRLTGVVYPALVVLTIVVTGNHFVVDAIAGMLVVGIGFAAALAWRGRAPGGAILTPATRGGAVR
jgi:PAP2 superfamily protein